jgi:lipoprotein-anchoring transpeptidase ErfK/SrfK
MGQDVRRWLVGLGAVAATAAVVLSQAGVAGAASAGSAGIAGSKQLSASQASASQASASQAGASQASSGQIGRGVLAGQLAPGSVYVPTGQVLIPGDHGPAVRALQQRLNFLRYYPGKIDGQFNAMTLEAVWAFKEVQGISTASHANVVGAVFQRKLRNPRLPRVLVPHGGPGRIEVSKNTGVLVLYSHGKVRLISHVSTGGNCLPGQGCGWDTPDGNYLALSFLPGWIQVPLGEMFNPVFFIGRAYAIHGELDSAVPLFPASHGCVRIPMEVANFLHDLVRIGTTHIYIRGHNFYG